MKKNLLAACTLLTAWYGSAQLLPELNHPNVNYPVRRSSYPHYLGDIKVELKKTKKGGIEGTVELPEGLTGTFRYGGITLDLTSGIRKL